MSSTSAPQTPTGQDVVSSLVASYNAKLTVRRIRHLVRSLTARAESRAGGSAHQLRDRSRRLAGRECEGDGRSTLTRQTLIAFSVLRPRNKLIYEPRRKYFTAEKTRAPKIGDGFLSWLGPILRMKEEEVFDHSGLDAVVLLRFMRMCRWIFTVVALITCAVYVGRWLPGPDRCRLIPISVIYNNQRVNSRARNTLSMLTMCERDAEPTV